MVSKRSTNEDVANAEQEAGRPGDKSLVIGWRNPRIRIDDYLAGEPAVCKVIDHDAPGCELPDTIQPLGTKVIVIRHDDVDRSNSRLARSHAPKDVGFRGASALQPKDGVAARLHLVRKVGRQIA
jgi:L-ascorbate metabolism protein UlaG (beta-lactamase superfamily)